MTTETRETASWIKEAKKHLYVREGDHDADFLPVLKLRNDWADGVAFIRWNGSTGFTVYEDSACLMKYTDGPQVKNLASILRANPDDAEKILGMALLSTVKVLETEIVENGYTHIHIMMESPDVKMFLYRTEMKIFGR